MEGGRYAHAFGSPPFFINRMHKPLSYQIIHTAPVFFPHHSNKYPPRLKFTDFLSIINMRATQFLLAATAASTAYAVAQSAGHGADEAENMGPVAFMWPPDRDYNEDHDNIAPCGSKAKVSDRTNFPLVGGSVALTIDDPAENVIVRISYKDG